MPRFCRHELGFTLLEMLLVVFILGSLAFVASNFVDNQDDQLRFHDTANRLDKIRTAVISNGSVVPAGFVADNGLLPSNIAQLVNELPTGWVNHGIYQPVFDGDPDALTGLNDGGSEIVLPSALALEKGWRIGTLISPAGANGTFGDGWRRAGAAPNYTWQVVANTSSLAITSLGKDNALGGANFNADIGITIPQSDWSRNIASYTIKVRNQSTTDISTRFGASLLVFENTATGAKWKRYSTNTITCLDGDGDNLVGGIPCGAEDTLSFPFGGYPLGSYAANRIPAGIHTLVLYADADATVHNGSSETLYPNNLAPAAQGLVCMPTGCPPVVMVIR